MSIWRRIICCLPGSRQFSRVLLLQIVKVSTEVFLVLSNKRYVNLVMFDGFSIGVTLSSSLIGRWGE